jgi:hypothetical protein
MPWSSAFLEELGRRRIAPRWVLEPVSGVGFEPVSGALKLSSHQESGFNECLMIEGNNFSAGEVQVGEWGSTMSEMVLAIRAVIDIRPLVARGQAVVLRMGFYGWAVEDYEPIYYGVVQAIDRSGDAWSLTLRSLVSALISRMTTDEAFPNLFSNVSTTELAAPGFLVASSVQVILDDASGAEVDSGLDGYLLQIFSSLGDGVPFFMRVENRSGDTFDIDDNDILGTVAEDAAVGDTVIICPYIHRDPVTAARRIIVSTGAGTNGASDTLPATWGLGLPQALLDGDDVATTDGFVATGDPWDIYSTERVANALEWLQALLQPAGIVLCERQGLLTIRACFPPDDPQYETYTVTDDDLMTLERYQTWDSESPVELAVVGAQSPGLGFDLGSGLGEALTSKPASQIEVIDLDYVSVSEAPDWVDAILERRAPWQLRVPEKVEILCAGLRMAAAAPFDSLIVDSRHFETRDGVELPTLMITKVQPDWWRGTVRITACYVPTDPEAI